MEGCSKCILMLKVFKYESAGQKGELQPCQRLMNNFPVENTVSIRRTSLLVMVCRDQLNHQVLESTVHILQPLWCIILTSISFNTIYHCTFLIEIYSSFFCRESPFIVKTSTHSWLLLLSWFYLSSFTNDILS